MPENGEKQQQVLLVKKVTLLVQHTFLYIFLPLFCTTFSRNVLVTRFWEEMSYLFSFTFFSLALIFTLHWWPLSFLIFPNRPYKIFTLFFQQKKCLLFLSLALDLCRPFSRLASLICCLFSLFLCLSLALYSKFVDMTINLSLILQTT